MAVVVAVMSMVFMALIQSSVTSAFMTGFWERGDSSELGVKSSELGSNNSEPLAVYSIQKVRNW
jgi:hypothetical protein